jgi:hypothetical protein
VNGEHTISSQEQICIEHVDKRVIEREVVIDQHQVETFACGHQLGERQIVRFFDQAMQL